MRVLISGAGVAGPALAFWLHRAGVEVTVVEQAPDARGSGYPVDLRGVAVDVVERMGLLEQVEATRTGTRRITFVSGRGATIASLDPATVLGERGLRAVELPRGDLSRILRDASPAEVEYVFDDVITGLDDADGGVRVGFRRNPGRTFDVVIGADGLHSGVRALAFGPEESVRRDLGLCYAGFSVPNTFGLDREAVMMNVPGRMATCYAVRGHPELIALLAFAAPAPALDHRDTDARRRLVEHAFGGVGWRVPELLARMRTAEDFHFDTVSQVRMASWSRGRVGLVGDAAYAPSFLSGQGTSLAVVGAYVLAVELAANPDDPAAALRGYERRVRGFVERNQDLAGSGSRVVAPATPLQLRARNLVLRALPVLSGLGAGGLGTDGGSAAQAATALTLPDEPAGAEPRLTAAASPLDRRGSVPLSRGSSTG